jgi:hypothetical protein
MTNPKYRKLGLDSEFSEVDFNASQTVPHRGQVVFWSMAFGTGVQSPLGFEQSDSVLFPAEALPVFRGLLESEVHLKYAHNAGSEYHAIFNTSGIRTAGLVDTLSWARWALPNRHPTPGYTAKSLAVDILRREIVGSYKEVMSEPAYVEKLVKVCVCGKEKCTRKKLPDHEKIQRTTTVERGTRLILLRDMSLRHERFPLFSRYAREDAEIAFELGSYLQDRVTSKPFCP